MDSLDSILKETDTPEVDLMLIQLNGVEPEAIKGLTQVYPKNFSIAARYKLNEFEPVEMIEDVLKERGYTVSVRKKDYIYASYNGK